MKIKIVIFLSMCITFFQFNCKLIEKETISTVSPTSTVLKSPTPQIENASKEDSIDVEKKTVTCKNKELSSIWLVLLKDVDMKKTITDANVGGDCSDYIVIEKKIDLNNDGNDEIFVDGIGVLRSASTKPILVMKEEKKGYKVLLREQGEIYIIKKTKTNGFKDLFFPSRRSSSSTFFSTYKFQNGKYQKIKCQIEIYNRPRSKKVFACDDLKGIEQFESSSFKE
jgi:hypothetical protein